MKRLIFLFACCWLSFQGFAQIESTYRVETFGSLSEKHTPFWITNQKWGAVPLEGDNFYLRGFADYTQRLNDDWSFDAGVDLTGANNDNYGHFWIQQLYGRLNWKLWRLDIGMREDYTSFLNPHLSSGDMIFSNNARPIPQVRLSLSDFLLIPYTKGNMYIKADFSVGRYLDGDYQEDIARPNNRSYNKGDFSHSKSLFLRFGNIATKHRMQFTAGLMHAAKWGGDLYVYSGGGYTVIDQPDGIDDLFRVMIAKEGSSAGRTSDQMYVAGSQWGAYLVKFDYKLKNDDQISAYIQHFFDDGSGMIFKNYRDNLLGLEYKSTKKSFLSGVVLEYLYTKQQTGPIHLNRDMDDEHRDVVKWAVGNDDYYNNSGYISGPSHYGKSFGTSLLLSPEYNGDGNVNFKSNRIIAYHLGAEGFITSALQYRLLMSAGKSWGRYSLPYTSVRKGIATQLEMTYTPPQWSGFDLKLAVGYDNGSFFGEDTFGGAITITKKGLLFSK
ncbi:hypothetical protein M2463_001877 [Parabacteroides sp. PH5-13]|uniref:capsule assembly Wzi family protein n=1 Tax=unclassified Parabacteroides TaxID=2649774 RepID=UPI0024734EB5|nr:MULTISPECIES: capsule assembly Wzi family protein [unclassified Parabacteroides]MDH6305580.1 hypothetical protein [Parabacteroides sp. PH5-39]MDH6319865.1 hypothetical protein [Parabacteroides sp. PH5-13]MDH6323544.1 hypothetical protein [Parabacteroides sp. PH5-8]MDH6384656.1 hypothetical protein [Parabacteroides sp. PH5-17]MDH6394011.1 hypothetical protein [Parabacteroides sp. PFB2-22]